MRTLSAAAVALAGAALVVVGIGPAVAQAPTASAVDGRIDECLVINVGSAGTGVGGSASVVNQVWKCQGSSDDAWLEGDIDIVYNASEWSGVGAVQWGWARITNDEGSWDGVWSSNVREDGEQIVLAWYQGSGAYEGWSYVETQLGQYQEPRDTFGILYPGDPPPSVVITPLEQSELPTAE